VKKKETKESTLAEKKREAASNCTPDISRKEEKKKPRSQFNGKRQSVEYIKTVAEG